MSPVMKRLVFCLLAACGDNQESSPDPGSVPATLEVFQDPLRVGEAAPAGVTWQFVDQASAQPCDFPLETLTCVSITDFTFVIESIQCDGCTVTPVDPATEFVGFTSFPIVATREGMTTLRVEIVDPDHDAHRSLIAETPSIAP